MPTVKHLVFLGLLGQTFLFSACNFEVEADLLVNTCGQETPCGSGTCVEGRCEAMPETSIVVDLLVLPTEASDVRPQHRFSGVELGNDLNLVVPTQVDVHGRVRFQEARVTAAITFTPEDPGSEVVRVNTLSEPQIEEGREVDFIARLVAGQRYRLTVVPTRGTDEDVLLPPLYLDEPLTTPPAIDGLRAAVLPVELAYLWDFSVPCGGMVTAACTLSGDVVSVDGEAVSPEAGLQVRAIDEAGRLVSTVATTDDNGAYAIAIGPAAPNFSLVVSGGSERPLFPQVVADPSRLSRDFRVRVPVIAPVRYEAMVEGPSGQRQDATAEFFGDSVLSEEGIVGTFRASTVATDGVIEAQLLPGNYTVVVTPTNSNFHMEQYTLEVPETAVDSSGIRGQLVALRRKPLLAGTVRVQAGESREQAAPSGATIEARRVGTTERSESIVDDTGRFAIPLEAGNYDLTIRLSNSTGFPWVLAPNHQVVEDAESSAELILDAPIPMRGVLSDAGGQPASGLEVRAFRTIGQRQVEIARTRVDAEGTFELLLPSTMGDF